MSVWGGWAEGGGSGLAVIRYARPSVLTVRGPPPCTCARQLAPLNKLGTRKHHLLVIFILFQSKSVLNHPSSPLLSLRSHQTGKQTLSDSLPGNKISNQGTRSQTNGNKTIVPMLCIVFFVFILEKHIP